MMVHDKDKKRRELLAGAYLDFKKGLTSYAVFKTHNATVGEDLVQDTFMKTWTYLVKGGKINLMRSFLFHILNDLIVDEYRKRKPTSLDLLIENGFEPVVEEVLPLAHVLDGKAILLLIKKLPKPYKAMITMRYIDHLTLSEISLKSGKSKNTVAVQMHRGISKLKKLYEPTV